MPSRSFGSKRPTRQNLVRAGHGLRGEVADLRKDVDDAFLALEEELASVELPTVIMLVGQSNMASGPPQTYGYSELTELLGPDILGFGHEAQAMVPVVDGTANARANHGGIGTGGGPGLGQVGTRIARHIADERSATVRTYALAYSGQAIGYFLPASVTMAKFEDGSSHATLNNYNLLKSYVAAAGHVPQLYVWIQGEADAGRTDGAYYADLLTLWTALQADYPGIKLLIVGTIQSAPSWPDDRGGVGGGSVAGVRIAQKRLAAENPTRIYYIDTKDMRGHTAWFHTNHYTAAGYEEVALRIFAALSEEGCRASVEAAQQPRVTYPAFEHQWGQVRSLGGGGALGAWSDDIGTDSLLPEGTAPTHVPSSDYFGGRTVVGFEVALNARLTEASIAGGNAWLFFAVCRVLKSAINGTNRCIWSLETAGVGGNRIAFSFDGSGFPSLFLNGSGVPFTGPAAEEGDVAHSYLVWYDGTAGEAKLWQDGFLVSELTGLADIDTGGAALIRVGSLSGAWIFGGEIALLACEAMPAAAPTDAVATALHAGARVEFGLET